jgi:hypothetical protein
MRACWEQAPERRRSAWPRVKLGATACAAWQRRADRGSAWPSSRNGRLALPFLILVATEVPPPNLVMLLRRAVRSTRALSRRCLGCWPKPCPNHEDGGPALGALQARPRGPGRPNRSATWAKEVTVSVSGRGRDAGMGATPQPFGRRFRNPAAPPGSAMTTPHGHGRSRRRRRAWRPPGERGGSASSRTRWHDTLAVSQLSDRSPDSPSACQTPSSDAARALPAHRTRPAQPKPPFAQLTVSRQRAFSGSPN